MHCQFNEPLKKTQCENWGPQSPDPDIWHCQGPEYRTGFKFWFWIMSIVVHNIVKQKSLSKSDRLFTNKIISLKGGGVTKIGGGLVSSAAGGFSVLGPGQPIVKILAAVYITICHLSICMSVCFHTNISSNVYMYASCLYIFMSISACL